MVKTLPYGVGSGNEMVARSMDRLHGAKLIRSAHLGGAKLLLTFEDAAQRKWIVQMAVIEHVEGKLPPMVNERAAKDVGAGRGRGKRVIAYEANHQYSQKGSWTARELEEGNLPLYWSETWLRDQLAGLGSLSEVGRVHGYKISTLENWRSRHGLDSIKPQKTEAKAKLLKAWEAGQKKRVPPTAGELATQFGVAHSSASNWIQEAILGPDEFKRQKALEVQRRIKARASVLRMYDGGERNLARMADKSGLRRVSVFKILEKERGHTKRKKVHRAKKTPKT
jgi:hypothetical protein